MDRFETAIVQKDEKRVKSLLYIDYMIKFLDLKPFELSKKDLFYAKMGDDLPSNVESTLFKTFTEMTAAAK